jgi:hypothetical protein
MEVFMKKKIALVVFFGILLTTSNVFAADSGDLTLNIEAKIGRSTIDGMELPNGEVYWDLGFGATVHYYLLNFFAVNTGLAYNTTAFFSIIGESGNQNLMLEEVQYITVPLGFSLPFWGWIAGAGITANFPIGGSVRYNWPDERAVLEDNLIDLTTYFGWYIDFGYDGFIRFIARLSGSFKDKSAGVPISGQL